jgi:hypothetical protein
MDTSKRVAAFKLVDRRSMCLNGYTVHQLLQPGALLAQIVGFLSSSGGVPSVSLKLGLAWSHLLNTD